MSSNSLIWLFKIWYDDSSDPSWTNCDIKVDGWTSSLYLKSFRQGCSCSVSWRLPLMMVQVEIDEKVSFDAGELTHKEWMIRGWLLLYQMWIIVTYCMEKWKLDINKWDDS